MNPKTKMKVRMAVKDYQEMYPEEYKDLMIVIEDQRQKLDNEMADIKTNHAVKRGLFTVSEKLSAMIALKLSMEERTAFKEQENARWFADEFPQFRLSKAV